MRPEIPSQFGSCWYFEVMRVLLQKNIQEYYVSLRGFLVAVSKFNKKTLRVVWKPDTALATVINKHLHNMFDPLPLGYDTLAAAAIKLKNQSVLLLLTNPIEDLAERFATSKNSAEALSDWKTETSALLKSARRMRRQLTLLDARAFLSHDPKVMEFLALGDGQPGTPNDIPPPPSPTALLLADALLTHDSDANRLVLELAALQHGSSAFLLGKEQVISAYQEHNRLVAQEDQLSLANDNILFQQSGIESVNNAQAVLVEESNLLRESLKLQLVDAENGLQHQSLLVAQIEHLSKIAAECEDLRKVAAECEDLRKIAAECEGLRKIAAECEGLRKVADKNTRLRKRVARSEISHQELQKNQQETLQKLDRVYSSNSWKITAPLRGMRAVRKRWFGKTDR